METYKNLKKGTKIGLIILAVLLLAVLAAAIISVVQLFGSDEIGLLIFRTGDAVISAFVLVYAFFGYKKPHGNMLKILFLIFAVYLAFCGTLAISGNKVYLIGDLFILAALTMAFVAGRLNKIEKNRFILMFGGMVLLAIFVIFNIKFPALIFSQIIENLTPMIILATLSFAYVARFEEHKAAGLADKADA